MAIPVMALLVVFISGKCKDSTAECPSYGADVSFPIHHRTISTNYAHLAHNADPNSNPTPDPFKGMPIQPLGNRQEFYNQFVEEVRQAYIDEGLDPDDFDEIEEDRIKSNNEQPMISVNFTETGFKKIRAPEKLRKLLFDFWEANKDKEEIEYDTGLINTVRNEPTMVDISDESLEGGGEQLQEAVWEATRQAVEEWTGQDLIASSVYGIRIYKEGNFLMPHVDRLPLICSAIVNVAQDVDEPWPLEVYDRSGNAVNITMEPGDLVLYESHSIIHGRPFPLKGRYYANIFIHFEPAVDFDDDEIPPFIRQDAPPELVDLYYWDEL